MEQFKPNHDHDQKEYQLRMDRIVEMMSELKKETDRGMAILGAAMLDEKLKTILTNFLIKGKQAERLLNGPNAPIGTFSAKLDMAFAVGLISEDEYQDAEIIRKIRNDFAHKFDLKFSFGNESVAARCKNFSIAKGVIEAAKGLGEVIEAKMIFQVVISSLDYKWMFREQHAQQLKAEAPDWRKFLFPDENA